ncbi:Pex19 protein, partial [Blastocladiella britannica]
GVLADLTAPKPAAAAAAATPATPAAATPAASADLDEDAFMKELSAGMEQMMAGISSADPAAMEQLLGAISGTDGASGAAPAPASDASNGKTAASFQERIRQTMTKLQESGVAQSEAAGADGAEDMDALMAEMMRQMEQLTDSGEFDQVLEGMMQSLLSKDILHEPLKDLHARYPDYLAANRDSLAADDLSMYEKQYALIGEILAIYNANPDGAAENEGSDAQKKVAELMHQVQELGQPPAEIMRELAPAASAAGAEGGADGEVPPECASM